MSGADLPGDLGDHVAVWFGTVEHGVPDVWTIPIENLEEGPTPTLKH